MMVGRKSSGNMLVLSVLTLCLVVAVAMLGFTFNSFLFQRTRTQYEVDAMTLEMARSINTADRVGQINELEAASRELIFTGQKRFEDCSNEDMEFLKPLCHQLLVESLEGKQQLAHEHNKLNSMICDEILAHVDRANLLDQTGSGFAIGFLRTQRPRIVSVYLGRINGVTSNVRELAGIPQLAQFDRGQNYVEKQTWLFQPDINARLSEPYSQLDFKMSSLPAYVQKTCSPSRNTNADAFIKTDTIFENGNRTQRRALDQTPSAVHINCVMDATVEFHGEKQTSVNVSSTASTNGGIAGN